MLCEKQVLYQLLKLTVAEREGLPTHANYFN